MGVVICLKQRDTDRTLLEPYVTASHSKDHTTSIPNSTGTDETAPSSHIACEGVAGVLPMFYSTES